MELTENQKLVLSLFLYLAPVLVPWMNSGFSTDRTSLGLLGGALLTVTIAFISDILSGNTIKKLKATLASVKPKKKQTP